MFEDRTYEKIMEEALATAPPGVDVRAGGIFYDAIAGACFQIARYYADLSTAFDLVFLTTSVDEYLDMKGSEYGVFRHPASSAIYEYGYTGSRPAVGERFFSDGKYFELIQRDGELCLEAEETGEDSGSILPGTPAVPLNNIGGLTASTFGKIIEPGTNTENDEDLRQRVREKIAGPAENGNRQHYKTWCEEVTGVGRARIIPFWNGENTVKGVLFGTDGLSAAEGVVERVQEYVDPEGTGLGNGMANIGAHFTAVAAEALPVSVSFDAVLASSSTEDLAREESTTAIRDYLKELALTSPDDQKAVVRVSAIGTLLYSLPSIIDYSGLTLNGAAANIEIETTQVAILEEVAIHAVVR